MIHTRCPIDDSDDSDEELYGSNFDPEKVGRDLFSARRVPDRVHYRMVRNRRTDCVRADPILDERAILDLYQRSRANHRDIVRNAVETYLYYGERFWNELPDYRGVLEIGCGSGLFLEEMLKMGFQEIAGVEPSFDAVQKAESQIRARIHQGVLEPGLYPSEHFSLICGFHVLDHMTNPNEVLRCCLGMLAPGGLTYWICHDVGWWTARVLGQLSPIVDIEHVVLYNRRNLAVLFEKNGFIVRKVFGVTNKYPLEYWLWLAPLSLRVKGVCQWFLRKTGINSLCFSANLGNMGIVAQKPR